MKQQNGVGFADGDRDNVGKLLLHISISDDLSKLNTKVHYLSVLKADASELRSFFD